MTSQEELKASTASETEVTGNIVRKFWKPDGKTSDKRNEARLRKWMSTNGLSDLSTTTFISREVFAQLRSKAIRDLGIASGERNYEKKN